MRIWSLHPSHLDHIALVAVWREGLLAKKVLEGNTKGYTRHPQLERFRSLDDPVAAINNYLHMIADEADLRGYKFDRTKLSARSNTIHIPLTDKQLEYEWLHHLKKSEVRTPNHHKTIVSATPKPNPIFRVVKGPIADWEKVH